MFDKITSTCKYEYFCLFVLKMCLLKPTFSEEHIYSCYNKKFMRSRESKKPNDKGIMSLCIKTVLIRCCCVIMLKVTELYSVFWCLVKRECLIQIFFSITVWISFILWCFHLTQLLEATRVVSGTFLAKWNLCIHSCSCREQLVFAAAHYHILI